MKADDLLLRPLLATAAMGVTVYGVWHFVFGDAALQSRLLTLLGTALCVALGIGVYFAAAWKLKAVRKEDLPAKIRRKLK